MAVGGAKNKGAFWFMCNMIVKCYMTFGQLLSVLLLTTELNAGPALCILGISPLEADLFLEVC